VIVSIVSILKRRTNATFRNKMLYFPSQYTFYKNLWLFIFSTFSRIYFYFLL
jgi:hypothetical protein